MASVNWTLLDDKDRKPVPLPREKWLFESRKVSLLLFPYNPQAGLNQQSVDKAAESRADGIVYASNQRVVFVAYAQQSTSALSSLLSFATGSSTSTTAQQRSLPQIESLSVPYEHFTDSRFHQPTFSASYVDALVPAFADGSRDRPHIARLTFGEGGGADFHSIVNEIKNRMGDRGTGTAEPEPLPLYEPGATAISDTAPNDSAIEAASVARACDEDERNASTTQPPPAEAPPSYAP